MRVSDTDDRSWPTSPVEWNVEPLVSCARSSRTTSRQPSCARWYAIDVPATPPPMITQRAADGSSRSEATQQLQSVLMLGVRERRAHAREVLRRIACEV